MAKVSKKLQQQIVEAIRQAHSGVVDQFLPECVENPPDLWTAEQTLKYDMLTDAEMKSVASAATASPRRIRMMPTGSARSKMTLTSLAAAVLFLPASAASASTQTVDGFDMGKVTKINVPSPLYDDAMVMVRRDGKKTICKVMMVRTGQADAVKAEDIKPRELSLYGCDEVTTGVAFHSPEQGK